MRKKIIAAAMVAVVGATATQVLAASAADNIEIIPTINTAELVVQEYYDVPLSDAEQDYLFEMCDKYDVEVKLALAVMETESNFHARTISATDDWGLFQINKCNHQWLREKFGDLDFLNPMDNIKAGCYLLGRYVHSYSTWSEALVAYNCGGGGANSMYFSKGIYESDYSKKVLESMEQWEELE